MTKEINNDTIAKFENDLAKHPAFNVASHAAQENGIFKASQNLQSKIDLDPTSQSKLIRVNQLIKNNLVVAGCSVL